MEQHINLAGAEVPKRRSVTGNTFADAIVITVRDPLFADAFATLPDPEAKTIATGKVVVMTGAARDISVA